jgi:putative Holliday junction resolvase
VTPAGTVLAFDFGTKRIGVAVGTTEVPIANPLGTIEAEANAPRFEALERYVNEWQPVLLVVGRPRHADGSPHETARLAEKFARRLRERFRVPVVFVDETLSSAAAESRLREARTRPGRKAQVDALAASIILQSFFDSPADHERLAS